MHLMRGPRMPPRLDTGRLPTRAARRSRGRSTWCFRRCMASRGTASRASGGSPGVPRPCPSVPVRRRAGLSGAGAHLGRAPRLGIDDLDDGHHAVVLVADDVAVVHEFADDDGVGKRD
jgi:hypothetical protein